MKETSSLFKTACNEVVHVKEIIYDNKRKIKVIDDGKQAIKVVYDDNLFSIQLKKYNFENCDVSTFADNFILSPKESIYLDTNWAAITSKDKPCKAIVTAYAYDCVNLCLFNDRTNTIGVFHISTNIHNNLINKFIAEFINLDINNSDNVHSALFTGYYTNNLVRCISLLKYNKIPTKISVAHQIISNGNLDDPFYCKHSDNLLPEDTSELYTQVAIDAASMSVTTNFCLEQFLNEYPSDILNKMGQKTELLGAWTFSGNYSYDSELI